MENNDPFKRRKHFLLLGIIPSLLFLTVVILTLSWGQRIHLSNAVQSDLNATYQMFYRSMYEEAKLLSVLTEQLSQRPDITNAFLSKNRNQLLEIATPLFHKIRRDYAVTHCYFHTLDRTNFLRVYEPQKFGDIIARFTLKKAAQTGALSYGLELGSLEGLTLRVVSPWEVDGRIIGYIELGKEIDHITEELRKILGAELVLVVKKSLLNRKGWEESAKIKGLASSWDQYDDLVVIDMTLPELPSVIDIDLSLPHHKHADQLLDLSINNRQYIAGFAPLLDASDSDIGEIIIIKDFTTLKAITKRLTVLLVSSYLLCLLLYLVFIFFYLQQLKGKRNSRVAV